MQPMQVWVERVDMVDTSKVDMLACEMHLFVAWLWLTTRPRPLATCTLLEGIVNIIRHCGASGKGGHLRIIDTRSILETSGHHLTFVTIAAHCTPSRLLAQLLAITCIWR